MKRLFLVLLLMLGFSACRTSLNLADVVPDEILLVADKESPGKHPYFDDKGTLKWYNDDTYDDALKSGKKIVLEIGRKKCGLCQKFVEKILPKFKSQLSNYVGVVSNVDDMNAKIKALVIKHMRHATLLPVVIVLDEKGKYVGGLYGEISEADFKKLLKK